MLTSLVFLQQVNVKKSEKLAKIANIDKENLLRKNATDDELKSHQKSELHPLYRKHNFDTLKLTPPPQPAPSIFRVKEITHRLERLPLARNNHRSYDCNYKQKLYWRIKLRMKNSFRVYLRSSLMVTAKMIQDSAKGETTKP